MGAGLGPEEQLQQLLEETWLILRSRQHTFLKREGLLLLCFSTCERPG